MILDLLGAHILLHRHRVRQQPARQVSRPRLSFLQRAIFSGLVELAYVNFETGGGVSGHDEAGAGAVDGEEGDLGCRC